MNTESREVKANPEFAERINPKNYNFSPKLVAIVGAIIGFDYGVRDGVRGGQLLAPISITSDGFVTAGSTMSDGGGAFIGEARDLESNIALYLNDLSAADREEFGFYYRQNVKDWRDRRDA